ncbi:SDR family oxidoreductase [Novosphingobium capsulatum]|uniref:SDR family oxidoreductase n=1 Tax=Novosphingobium capsulatum TaxID=13688 RepID=UPI000A52368B|nr:SDR family oxidoreductase [Novosphingobium capsulatum]WQD91440.1 SDR family oxidoreductase [Novosphingobium capsulatum]
MIFANAGGCGFAPLGAISEEHYQQTFGTNVKGVLFTVQKALPLLRDGASVVLTSSVTAITGTAAFSVYSVTKAEVRNFARSWILDLKDRKIRVNIVSLGPIETAGLVELAGPDAAAQQGLLDFMAGQVPLGRVGQPEEVAKAVLFLATDRSSYVNGIELFIDGAWPRSDPDRTAPPSLAGSAVPPCRWTIMMQAPGCVGWVSARCARKLGQVFGYGDDTRRRRAVAGL